MKVIHVFNGNLLHLTPGIIKSFVGLNSKLCSKALTSQFFCVIMFGSKMIYDHEHSNPYIKLFEELSFSQYKLFYSRKELYLYLLRLTGRDKIIYHGALSSKDTFVSQTLMSIFNNRMFRRSTLICWGSDYQLAPTSLIKRWFNKFLSWVYSSFQYVVAISQEDVNEISSKLPKANVVFAPYMASEKRVFTTKTHHDGTIVMVSHSGWLHNQHLRSFEILYKFRGLIKVVCPLCYGDPDYIQNVIVEGTRLFGKDFSYFTELKPIDEYREFLRGIDILVTAAEIQTGMGAIFLSMVSGTKVFVTGNLLSSLQQQSYKVFDLDSIKDMDFETFAAPLSLEKALFNVENYNHLKYDGSEALDVWKLIFRD